MDYIGSDSQRALIGGTAGAAVAVGIVASMFDAVPTWFAIPGGIVLVGGWACMGGMVALAIGDWWDRR